MATLIWTSVGSESATTVATQKLTRFFAELIRSDRMRAVQRSSGLSMRISSHRGSHGIILM